MITKPTLHKSCSSLNFPYDSHANRSRITHKNLINSNHNLLRNLKSRIWQIKFSKQSFSNKKISCSTYFECLPSLQIFHQASFILKSSISFHESKSSSGEVWNFLLCWQNLCRQKIFRHKKRAFFLFCLLSTRSKDFLFQHY